FLFALSRPFGFGADAVAARCQRNFVFRHYHVYGASARGLHVGRTGMGESELALLLSIPSPTYAQEMSLAGTFGLRINYFWSSILVQLGISTLSICLACAILPHAW